MIVAHTAQNADGTTSVVVDDGTTQTASRSHPPTTSIPSGRRRALASPSWLVHRVNSDFHLREEHYGDDAASLLVQISWPAGRNEAPRVTTLRTCSRERC